MAETVVLLDCKVLGVKGKAFGVTHAQNLLQYQKRKGKSDWEISPNSGHKFKDGIITSTGNRKHKESEEPGADHGSESA